jgi:hypothetical protein
MYYEVSPDARRLWSDSPHPNAVQFTNKFFAAQHAISNNLHIHFNLYESAFDSVDWSKDPALSWDQLLDMRARQIAAKNKPIVLYFSGGTDSYTIYKVFERNHIPLNAIYLRKRPDNAEGTWDKVYELFNSGLYDSNTKLIIDDDHAKSLASAYNSSDWMWEGGFRQFFGMICADRYTHDCVKSALGRDDIISVIGLEKPIFRITEDAVYSYQDDDNYARLMNIPGIDCFYISPDLPELHVKQSYMMLNYIKSQCPSATSPKDIQHYEQFQNASYFPNWYDYSIKASGRFGDLNRSDLQHQANDRSTFYLPKSGKFDGSEMTGRPARWFQDLYKTDRTTFNNFTNGYMSLMTDSVGKFLHHRPTNAFDLRTFPSKHYQLTF